MRLILLFAYLLFATPFCLHAQTDIDKSLGTLLNIIEKDNVELEDTSAKENKTGLLYPLFGIYKLIFSQNDVPKMCRFHPTCGNYGSLALKKYGMFIGALKTGDRLTRCNNLHYKDQYIYLLSKNKYVDFP